MNRLAIVCAALGGLAVSACASQPQAMDNPQAKRSVTPPGGLWEVVQATAIGPTGANQSPYMGQRMALYQANAGDPAGRSCAQPVYMGWEGTPESVVGAAAPSQDMRPVMEVTCDGQPFGTYVGMADGHLMTRVNDWALSLKRLPSDAMAKAAEPLSMPMPEPMKAPEPAPAPAPVQKMEEAKPMAEPAKAAAKPMADPDKRTIVYLASYKSEAMAQKGWKVLAKKSPVLAKQQPVINHVDLGKKGQWYRLYGLAGDEAERGTICKQLGKLVDECGSRLRE